MTGMRNRAVRFYRLFARATLGIRIDETSLKTKCPYATAKIPRDSRIEGSARASSLRSPSASTESF